MDAVTILLFFISNQPGPPNLFLPSVSKDILV